MTVSTSDLVAKIVSTLNDSKGQAICETNLKGITDVAEYGIVCTATSSRHANTLADYCWVAAKALDIEPLGKEGSEDGEWVLLDFGHVILHIMLASVRDHYKLEDMWCLKPDALPDALDED